MLKTTRWVIRIAELLIYAAKRLAAWKKSEKKDKTPPEADREDNDGD